MNGVKKKVRLGFYGFDWDKHFFDCKMQNAILMTELNDRK